MQRRKNNVRYTLVPGIRMWTAYSVIIDDKTDECGEEKENFKKKFTVQYCISLRQYSSNTSQRQTPEIPYYCQQ